NELKVLLISDPFTDKAAASVDINSGSNSDPAEFAGLAHFLEHMLFLGTEKYPAAGEYQEYIASHGGGHNAYTAYENTNYYFDIEKGYLEPALDRFSQFFIGPLFTPEYVDRERNAVHSEYQSNLQNDSRRAYATFKAVINQEHPLSQFSVGSLDTLQDKTAGSLREALLQHYRENYSANIMSLAILGSESLDELEVMARESFSNVKNYDVEVPATSEAIFTAGQLPALLQIKPIRDSRRLSYTFPIPVVRDYYKSKPLAYLGNVLGHEGEGSLLSLLKEKGWVNSLSAGGGMSYRDNATFSISVGLTEEGVNRVDEISSLVFQFIDLVKREGIQAWLFNEQKSMAELSFLFQEPAQPISYVSSMSRRLQEYPAAEIITASYAYDDFDAQLLDGILAQLRPDNVLLTYTSQGVSTNKVEANFGAEYSYNSLSEERIARWRHGLIEPALVITTPNPFLPENLDLKPFTGSISLEGSVEGVEEKPELILDEAGMRLWFKQDNEFQLPRANFYLYAMTPIFNASLENALLSDFVISLVNDKLNEYSYPANLAGLFYGVSRRSRGFSIRLGGYNDKQEILLEALLKTIVAADFTEERFEIIKAEKIRAWGNASKQTPYVRLLQETQALLINPYWSEQQRIAAVQNINLEDVKDFVPLMLSNLKIDALYHGNVLPADALSMVDIASRYLQSSAAASNPEFGTVIKLEADTRVVQEVEVEHDDSAIVIYVQAPDDSLASRARVSLLAAIMRPSFYDTLRTEKQLGYVVNAGTMPILKINGLLMYIESPGTDPIALEKHIDEYLNNFDSELEAMTQLAFDDIKAGMLNNIRQKPQRLSSLSGRYWSDILIEEYENDSTLLMADAIESLTKVEIVSYYRDYVLNRQGGRLISRSVGNPHQAAFVSSRAESAENMLILNGRDGSSQDFKENAERYYFNREN
ncbi:insulinase family protein, partial [Gammaproteobacteria bacterium]|nr:insulinase family protein [Gammaproteobacteria bacterium]